MASTSPPRFGRATATDTLAGAAGGMVSILLGQPFDLVKLRLQTSNSSNVLRVVSDIFKNEGALAFYKGGLLPFLGSTAGVSIQFSVFHGVKKALETYEANRSTSTKPVLSSLDLYLAGAAAGITNSIVSGPVELIKIRLQIQPIGASRLFTGPWDCAKKLIAAHGLKSLFRGQGMTIVREGQAFGMYFVTFETCMRRLAAARGQRQEELPTLLIATCGAGAGVVFWVGSYPLDVIKSKLQSDGFGQHQRYPTAWAAAVQTWNSGRTRAFFRGLGPTLLRTMLSSSGTFATVENIRRLLT